METQVPAYVYLLVCGGGGKRGKVEEGKGFNVPFFSEKCDQ